MHITHAGRTGGLTTLLAPFAFAEGLVELLIRRRAIHDLNAMDDRMLKDIGLSRGEIDHAVKNGRF